MKIKYILWILVFVMSLSCQDNYNNKFIEVKNGQFLKNGKPYYYIGTNYWYGTILASNGKWGNRDRLIRELDLMKDKGIDNLRILVGAEGPDYEPNRVTPALQIKPGKYNDSLLIGLDFLLNEMKKRNQYAILYLQNSWEWSGGYAQYLNWNGYGNIPYPAVPPGSWPKFMEYSKEFHTCEPCLAQFYDYVRFIIGRTNSYNGLKYNEDPTIMTWEIGNEPRAFSDENIPHFKKWIKETASLIKSLDSNHLVTTGTEGQHGCRQSIELFEEIHTNLNIDYLTMHIWPKNWAWLDVKDITGSIDSSILKTNIYMDSHITVARKLKKPIVLEEFGLPRDHHGYNDKENVTARDKYYKNAFDYVLHHSQKNDVMAGCNFWSFGGEERPDSVRIFWKPGDPYLGDPPCEEQGLNSVFDTDPTMNLIQYFNNEIKNSNF